MRNTRFILGAATLLLARPWHSARQKTAKEKVRAGHRRR